MVRLVRGLSPKSDTVHKLVVSQSLIVIKELGIEERNTGSMCTVAFPRLAHGRCCIMISFCLSPVGAAAF